MAKEFVLNNKIGTKKFGFDKIYTVKYKPNLTAEKIEKDKIKAVIIEAGDIDEARKMIDKLYALTKGAFLIIVKGGDDDFNRKILENNKINILLSPESEHKAKPLKQRDSGLNQVLCRIARENNIIIAINIQEITERKGKQKSELLSKIKQNIKLCVKAKTKIILTTLAEKESELRDIYDLKSLARSLGMPTYMAKEAVEKSFL